VVPVIQAVVLRYRFGMRQVPNQQIPTGPRESLPQWPADEPYSVIASNELGLCETMLGKEFPFTLASHKQPGCSAEGLGQVRPGGRDVRQELRLCETILG
jgi:hypothetical protein